MAFHSTHIKNKRSDEYNKIECPGDNLKKIKAISLFHLIELLVLIVSIIPVLGFTEEFSSLTVSPTGNYNIELLIKKSEPIDLEIDTKYLDQNIFGKVPIRFYSEDGISLLEGDEKSNEVFWHNKQSHIMEGGIRKKLNNNESVSLTLNATDEMVGKKVRVILEKEENFSKVAAIGAFLPQLVPMFAANNVVWVPHNFWTTFFRWNYLLLELDLINSLRELLKNKVFAENTPLLAQCSADFVEGFTVYQLTNYGTESPGTNREDIFRTYMRTTPPNRFLDCISSVVANSLQSLQHDGKLQGIFGNWSMLETLNDEALDGISKLMVGYGFNLLADTTGMGLKSMRSLLGFSVNNDQIGFDFNIALKSSIQYTIHRGYLTFFKGRGWDSTSAYALSTGAGLLEIAYRAYQAKALYGEYNNFNHPEVTHQIKSIGERAEAMASSGYQLIPLPENVKQYAVPAVAVTVLTGLAYYAANSIGIMGMHTDNGLSRALQQAAVSGTNALVLGALAYIILPYVKDLGVRGTQMLADQLVSWTDSEKDSWIGYFAARDTQYRIRVEIVH